jgi:hypothetical protein
MRRRLDEKALGGGKGIPLMRKKELGMTAGAFLADGPCGLLEETPQMIEVRSALAPCIGTGIGALTISNAVTWISIDWAVIQGRKH